MNLELPSLLLHNVPKKYKRAHSRCFPFLHHQKQPIQKIDRPKKLNPNPCQKAGPFINGLI